MGPSRPHRSSLSSIQVGFSLCLTSEMILLFSMPRVAEVHPFFGVYPRPYGFQDLGVGLTFLRRQPDNLTRPGGWRASRRLSLLLLVPAQGAREPLSSSSFFFFFFFSPAAIPHPFVGSGCYVPSKRRG